MKNIGSSPTVMHCTFSSNTAGTAGGGGIYNSTGSPTLIGCTFSGNTTGGDGGGVYNVGVGSNSTVIDCTFVGNTAGSEGGGLYNWSSNPTIAGCTFTGNSAAYGGGIRNHGSSPMIAECTFTENTASARGGGLNGLKDSVVIDCSFIGNTTVGPGGGIDNEVGGHPMLVNCEFRDNSASSGGGMSSNDGNATLINCTFSANVAGIWGGGLMAAETSYTVTNCTFSDNSAGTAGGGVFAAQTDPAVTNCILWGNSPQQVGLSPGSTASVTYSDVQDGWPGAGNIDADPLFVSTSNCCVSHASAGCSDPVCEAAVSEVIPGCCDVLWVNFCADTAKALCACPADTHLMAGSPCIDAGDNSALPRDVATDLDGEPRFVEDPETPDTGNPSGGRPIVDMGAYEYRCPWDCDAGVDGSVNVGDLLTLLAQYDVSAPAGCTGGSCDFNADGCVDVADLLELLAHYNVDPAGGIGCPQ